MFSLRSRQEKCVQARAATGDREKDSLADYFETPEQKICAAALAEKFLSEKVIALPGYIPHPQDNISDVYGIEGDDLDDIVEYLLGRLKCRMPTTQDLENGIEVHTVGDLVNWLVFLRSDPGSLPLP